MKRNFFIVAFLLAAILYAYWGLWDTFFQQDEWASLGFVQANGLLGNIGSYSFPELFTGKERIAGSLLNNAFHFLLPLRVYAFSLFAIFVHLVNSFLVFRLLDRFTRRPFASFAGALFFAVASTPSQAVSWISANTTTLPNALFALLSLHAIISYAEKKKELYLTLSLVSVYISFLFKESSLFLFVFLPFLYFTKTRASLRELARKFWPVVAFLVFAIAVRLWGLNGAEGQGGVYVTRGSDTGSRMLVHAFFYPVLGISQVFIPKEILFPVSQSVSHTGYEFLDAHPLKQAVSLILVGDLVSLYASIVLLVFVMTVSLKQKELRRQFHVGMAFVLLSFLPFIVLDRPASAFLESRYYYLSAVGAAFLVAGLLSGCMVLVQKIQRRWLGVLFAVLIWMSFAAYLYKNAVYIRRGIQFDKILADERKNFLRQMDAVVSKLPDNPIFLISGDSPGYYGIGDLSVPFQQGMGYTVMVWFYKTGKIPKELLASMFLWNINAQGYKEAGGGGFGYFWDEKTLAAFLAERPDIPSNRVIRLRYVSGEKKLVYEGIR